MTKHFDHIIFDIGNVLFEWNPEQVVRKILKEDPQFPYDLPALCESALWQDLDRGRLNIQGLINLYSKEYCPKKLNQFFEISLHHFNPIPEGMELLKECKKKYSVFILSNMSWDFRNHLKDNYPALSEVDGAIFSCEVDAIKPEPQIYEILLKRFAINPEKSLFLDDRKDNLAAAEKFGISGLLVDSYPRCLNELKSLNVI